MTGRAPNLTLATAGAHTHGKTSLVRRLTGYETDRLREEKQRGMSLELGYAPVRWGPRESTLVDVPGHEDYLSVRLAGTTGSDGVLLVVAADGFCPQTLQDELTMLSLLGLRQGLVALSKIDRLFPDGRQQARLQLQAALQGTFLEGAPLVPVSSVTGEGWPQFEAALEALLSQLPGRPTDGVFRLPLDRAFTVAGLGAGVLGLAVAGEVHCGDDVVLLPHGQVGRVQQIAVLGRSQPTAQAGQVVVLEIGGWDPRTIQRGDVLTLPGYFAPRRWLLAQLTMLPSKNHVWKSGMPVTLYTGTAAVPADLYPLEGAHLPSGGTTLAQLHTAEPLVAVAGDALLLRSSSPPQIVGGGRILDTSSRRLPRNSPALLNELARRAEAWRQPRAGTALALPKAGA